MIGHRTDYSVEGCQSGGKGNIFMKRKANYCVSRAPRGHLEAKLAILELATQSLGFVSKQDSFYPTSQVMHVMLREFIVPKRCMISPTERQFRLSGYVVRSSLAYERERS